MDNQNTTNQTPYINPTITNQQPQIPAQKNNYSVVIILCLIIMLLIGISAYLYGVNQGKTQVEDQLSDIKPADNNQFQDNFSAPTTLPTNTQPINPEWIMFTDPQFDITFRYPSRFNQYKPMDGGEAPIPGNYRFLGSTKADSFFVDVTPFTETLNQFIAANTKFDTSIKLMTATLHITTTLGDLVPTSDKKFVWYKHVEHYDLTQPNPGGVPEIITYTGFIKTAKNGVIMRFMNAVDNFAEVQQIAATIN